MEAQNLAVNAHLSHYHMDVVGISQNSFTIFRYFQFCHIAISFAFGSNEILNLGICSCRFQVISPYEMHVCVSTAFEVTSTSGRIF